MTIATDVQMDEKGKKYLGEKSVSREGNRGRFDIVTSLGTACSSLLHQYSKLIIVSLLWRDFWIWLKLLTV